MSELVAVVVPLVTKAISYTGRVGQHHLGPKLRNGQQDGGTRQGGGQGEPTGRQLLSLACSLRRPAGLRLPQTQPSSPTTAACSAGRGWRVRERSEFHCEGRSYRLTFGPVRRESPRCGFPRAGPTDGEWGPNIHNQWTDRGRSRQGGIARGIAVPEDVIAVAVRGPLPGDGEGVRKWKREGRLVVVIARSRGVLKQPGLRISGAIIRANPGRHTVALRAKGDRPAARRRCHRRAFGLLPLGTERNV